MIRLSEDHILLQIVRVSTNLVIYSCHIEDFDFWINLFQQGYKKIITVMQVTTPILSLMPSEQGKLKNEQSDLDLMNNTHRSTHQPRPKRKWHSTPTLGFQTEGSWKLELVLWGARLEITSPLRPLPKCTSYIIELHLVQVLNLVKDYIISFCSYTSYHYK